MMSVAYNRFGSHLAKEFKTLAKFDESQSRQIDQITASFHSWHRVTELPHYAELLRGVVDDINSTESVSYANAEKWWAAAQDYSDSMRACSPLNGSADLFTGLGDLQVRQIAGKLQRRLKKREDRYHAEKPSKRVQRRFKEIKKRSAFAGVTFNRKQEQLLRKTLAKQVSLGKQRHQLRRVWINQFVGMLQRRRADDFKNKITQHMDKGWNLTSTGFPEQWKQNEQLWKGFIKDFINLQTKEQRWEFLRLLRSTASKLDKMAGKKVKAEPVCFISALTGDNAQ